MGLENSMDQTSQDYNLFQQLNAHFSGLEMFVGDEHVKAKYIFEGRFGLGELADAFAEIEEKDWRPSFLVVGAATWKKKLELPQEDYPNLVDDSFGIKGDLWGAYVFIDEDVPEDRVFILAEESAEHGVKYRLCEFDVKS